ncbi:MAG: DNA repair protein RecN, partial [Gemmiger sp.]
LNELYYGARELATELADRLDAYDFDPGELNQIEERLDQIYRIKQRYGASVEELLARRDRDAEELEGYQSSGKRIAELTQRKQELYRSAKEAAEQLTQSRLKAFTHMNKQMREALEFLNMPGVRMALRHQRGPLASAGQDSVEFLISTNPGEEPKPLAKIASGGELSRIMLAFKSALADKDAIPTVIYDEIDTGVSGLAAGRIGQKLKQTAQGHQVLCITHTPQIAAFADQQLLIQKNVRGDRTYTEIHPLDLDGRVQVLARMISGDKVTELSLANARELIEKSQC